MEFSKEEVEVTEEDLTALKAICDKEVKDFWDGLTDEEKERSRELDRKIEKAKHNYPINKFKEKPTLMRAKQVLIYLIDQGRDIPQEVTDIIFDDIRKQVEDYKGPGLFDRSDREINMQVLENAILFKDPETPQYEIFEKYAEMWNIKGDVDNGNGDYPMAGWQKLRDRYRKYMRKNQKNNYLK